MIPYESWTFLNSIYKLRYIMTQTIYEKVAAKRKNWQPITPTSKESCTEGMEDLLSKALCFRFLELPVYDFIMDGLSRSETSMIGDAGKDALIRNTEDEVRHDTALNNCVAVFSNYNKSFEEEATQIVDAWIAHPDHPILKAAMLENSLFFLILPLFRRFGGDALRITSIDISADEVNHVQIHRHVAKELNQKPSRSADNLRKQTVDWLVSGFAGVDEITADLLRSASDNLLYKGVAPELNFSRSFQVPAFFERRNDTLPYYA